MESKKYGFQAVMDENESIARAYKASVYPTNYVISRDGHVVCGWLGFDEKILESTIKGLFKD
jgi:hypothetical protein